MTAICQVCGKDVEEGSHGSCFRDQIARLLQVIAGQRTEIETLRAQLQDAGILSRRR